MLRILLFLGTNLAVVLLLGFVLSLLGINQVGGLNLGSLLIFSAVFGFGGALISLFISKWMAKMSMGVEIIEQPQNEVEEWLLATVAHLAEKAGIAMPEVGIFPSEAPNAFATGWNKNDALVAVSVGLLQTMDADEIEAVLGHEIAHIANGDMVTLTLIQGVVNTFVIFLARIIGYMVDKVILGNRDEEGMGIGYFISSMIAEFVLGFFAAMIVAWFSRWREYRADAGGAELAGRHKMIAALQALQNAYDAPMPDEMAAFAISGRGLHELFASHPPLEDRIAALMNQV